MAIYAVIDTNVIVSSLLSKHEDAAPAQIVRRLFEGEIVALYNDEILREYEEVLLRPKFRFSEELVFELVDAIRELGLSVERVRSDERFPDPKDVVFYEVALARRRDGAYLVTGNTKHFPAEPCVVTPAEMLRIMDGE